MLLSLIVFSKSAKNLKKDNNNRDSVIVLRNPNNLSAFSSKLQRLYDLNNKMIYEYTLHT